MLSWADNRQMSLTATASASCLCPGSQTPCFPCNIFRTIFSRQILTVILVTHFVSTFSVGSESPRVLPGLPTTPAPSRRTSISSVIPGQAPGLGPGPLVNLNPGPGTGAAEWPPGPGRYWHPLTRTYSYTPAPTHLNHLSSASQSMPR